jgi:hypothetical protein
VCECAAVFATSLSAQRTIHLSVRESTMDCFAALAMTVDNL